MTQLCDSGLVSLWKSIVFVYVVRLLIAKEIVCFFLKFWSHDLINIFKLAQLSWPQVVQLGCPGLTSLKKPTHDLQNML